MSLISLQYIFSAGTTIIASQHNTNNTTIYNDYNGNITSANIAASAGILYSQLSLGGNIVNADISGSAGIASSKINLGASHQGDIFVDNGSGITRLVAGTSGQFLQTQGASSNPVWASNNNGSQFFKSSGTFTAPSGVSVVYLTMISGGGGAAGTHSGTLSASGGGASGAWIIGLPYSVTAGNSYTVTVNSGGAGGIGGGNNGANGGSVTFDTLTIPGGNGSTSANGGAAVTAGYIPSGRTAGTSYNYANIAGVTGDYNSSPNGGGAGGGSLFGLGGNGGATPVNNGSNATGYGAGGGGSAEGSGGNSNGGNGSNGFVLVQY